MEAEQVVEPNLSFCPGCFASSENGSWGEVVHGNWCANCGATGTVMLPRWAIDSIRKQASWVGKRFYPNQEDMEQQRELRYLRSVAPSAPFTVEASESPAGEKRYYIKRDGTQIGPYASELFAKTEGIKSLPYPVPKDFEPIAKRKLR